MERKFVKHVSLEALETGPGAIPSVWRLVRDNPGLTTRQLSGIWYGKRRHLQMILSRLVKLGWLSREGKQKPGYFYFATRDGQETKRSDAGLQLDEVRRSLTQLSRKAHDARYTGLAGKMGAALMEIEKELQEIRDQLYVRSFVRD